MTPQSGTPAGRALTALLPGVSARLGWAHGGWASRGLGRAQLWCERSSALLWVVGLRTYWDTPSWAVFC